MIRRHFATRAEVERQMAAPHQLRAETLGGALWMLRYLRRSRRGALSPAPRDHRPPAAQRLVCPDPGRHDEQCPPGVWIMKPLSAHHGAALRLILRLLQRGISASVSRLRNTGLAQRVREIGLARRGLPEGQSRK